MRVAKPLNGAINVTATTKLRIAALGLFPLAVVVSSVGMRASYLRGTEESAPQQAAPPKEATAKQSPVKEVENKDSLAEFKEVYALKRREDLKRVAPPFPDSRTDFISSLYGAKSALPSFGSMYLRWQDGFHLLGANSSAGSTLQRLPQHLAGIYPQELEGDQALLDKVIEGDFIVRKGLPAQKFVEGFETILRRECDLAVKLSLREVDRTVFVAQGKYKHTAIEGRSGALEIYGKELGVEQRGGGGSGEFPEMLQHVGAWVGRRIINEVNDVPKKVSWHYNFRTPFTEKEHAEDKDAEAVLGHLAQQTGLTFDEQTRKVRVLFVEE